MNHRIVKLVALCVSFTLLIGILTGCSSSENKSIITDSPAPTETVTTTPEPIPDATETEKSESTSAIITADANLNMTPVQRNSIVMLNYIAGVTQETNASKHSRIYLETAYSLLMNNTHPNAVDEKTQDQLIFLLDTMNNYRMLAVKREHLQFIYEQNRAQAIRSAVPNPLGLLSAVSSFDWKRIAVSVLYMAVDSYTQYKQGTTQAELQYIQDGWDLDEKEQDVLHSINTETFKYLNETVREHSLPGDLALNEEAITTFVSWKNNSNISQRIRWLESNKERYKAYGDYWLVLAESYYYHGDYEKCLKAVAIYESLEISIFRDDKGLARILPLAIIAAQEVYGAEDYIFAANHYCELILQNTDDNYDWALRYFAAQTYVDLYAKTNNQDYLRKAYEITLDNVNWLIGEQRDQNAAYLADVKEEPIPSGTAEKEKTEIENYNKQLREDRKLALPPVYEPLLLNCELYFSLADKLQISDSEKAYTDEMLHENGGVLFLIPTLDADYTFNSKATIDTSSIEITFTGKDLVIPAKYVSNRATISVQVKNPVTNEEISFIDWTLVKVERPEKNNLDSFRATYTSSAASKYHFTKGSHVTIIVRAIEGSKSCLTFEYAVVNTKTDFFSTIAFWNSDIGFARTK